MPMPTLNFVWVGLPRLDKGAKEIIGPVFLYHNLKKHGGDDPGAINPMVFWCQAPYKSVYEDYFRKHGLTINVSSIETFLDASLDPMAGEVMKYYSLLTAPKPIPVINCIYAKDLIFNFILATQGGYVLDTTIYPLSDDTPVQFLEYDQFKLVINHMGKSYREDVYIQYAPPVNLSRARRCLSRNLELLECSAIMTEPGALINPAPDLVDEIQSELGYIDINSARLGDERRSVERDFVKYDPEMIREGVIGWIGEIRPCDYEVRISELSVVKEFNNSYKKVPVSIEHGHIAKHQIDRLEFYLKHGGNANVTANKARTYLAPYLEYETLLNFTLRRYPNSEVVSLLLRYGADPNLLTAQLNESGLTHAMDEPTGKILGILLNETQIPINMNTVINGLTLLEIAIKKERFKAFTLLIDHGADYSTLHASLSKYYRGLTLTKALFKQHDRVSYTNLFESFRGVILQRRCLMYMELKSLINTMQDAQYIFGDTLLNRFIEDKKSSIFLSSSLAELDLVYADLTRILKIMTSPEVQAIYAIINRVTHARGSFFRSEKATRIMNAFQNIPLLDREHLLTGTTVEISSLKKELATHRTDISRWLQHMIGANNDTYTASLYTNFRKEIEAIDRQLQSKGWENKP